MRLLRAIAGDDISASMQLLDSSPSLARQCLAVGATRQSPADFFWADIGHYLVAGDTPLHVAAAGYRTSIAQHLILNAAKVEARNRRGAEPLHYAADGGPGLRTWNPRAQAEMITLLVGAGANPNALNKSGVSPLHRAVRQRCASAVEALLRNGADVRLKNKNGSTPLHLAVQSTGKAGTGSPASRSAQREILHLLLKAGGDPADRDARGKTATECAQGDWMRAFLAALSG